MGTDDKSSYFSVTVSVTFWSPTHTKLTVCVASKQIKNLTQFVWIIFKVLAFLELDHLSSECFLFFYVIAGVFGVVTILLPIYAKEQHKHS